MKDMNVLAHEITNRLMDADESDRNDSESLFELIIEVLMDAHDGGVVSGLVGGQRVKLTGSSWSSFGLQFAEVTMRDERHFQVESTGNEFSVFVDDEDDYSVTPITGSPGMSAPIPMTALYRINDALSQIWVDAGLGDEAHDDALNDLTHEVANRILNEGGSL